MNRTIILLTGFAWVAALGPFPIDTTLAMGGECTGPKAERPPECDDGGSSDGGGKDQWAASLDDGAAGIKSDGNGLYINGNPGVDVKVGGAARGIRIDLNSDGSQGDRFFVVTATCVDDPFVNPCPEGSEIPGEYPATDTDEYAILDVFHVTDMPIDGLFYPKNARFHIAGLAGGEKLSFEFREPELFNSGGVCSNENGSIGAGASVWVARFENTWTVTTEDPAPRDLGPGVSVDDAGDIACLQVLVSAIGSEFGGNYSLAFSVEVGPESIIIP